MGPNMVLQRGQAIPVWGWPAPGDEISVTLDGVSAKATVDGSGKWMVKLASLSTGGPHELVVEGSKRISVSNVMVGEV